MERSEHKLFGRIYPDTCEQISKKYAERFGIGTYLNHLSSPPHNTIKTFLLKSQCRHRKICEPPLFP